MLFSKKDSSDKTVKAKKSGLRVGSLFNPNIGATLRPLGDTGNLLIMLIAHIFAANGLFPRNHPFILGAPNSRVTFGELIATGWRNVNFTRDGLRQSIIFFAVVLSLISSTIFLFAMVGGLFVGTAHAQVTCPAPTCFQPPAPLTDIALGWINWMFLGAPSLANFLAPFNQIMPVGSTGSLPMSTTIQVILVDVLGMYSYAMLVIGGGVLFYHLTAMIMETAHHGVVMGRRANQVWAPIRLVVAVGLLVPFGYGLNAGQFIIVQCAIWGSNLASNAWALFVDELSAEAYDYVPPLPPGLRGVVADTYMAQACIAAYNAIVAVDDNPGGGVIPAGGVPLPQPDGSTKFSYSPVLDDGVTLVRSDDKDLCGYYIVPADLHSNNANEQNLIEAARTAAQSSFLFMFGQAITYATDDVLNFLTPRYGGTGSGPLGPNTDLEQQVADFADIMWSGYQFMAGALTNTMLAVAAAAREQGWAGAGSWFNTISRLQGAYTDIPRDSMYKTAPPQVDYIVRTNWAQFAANSTERLLQRVMTEFSQWVYDGFSLNVPTAPVYGSPFLGSPEQTRQRNLMLADVGIQQQGAVNKPHFMDDIFQAIDFIASMNGVWKTNPPGCETAQCFTLGVTFDGANPIAEIARLGHDNINTAYDLFDDYLVLQGIASTGRDGGRALSSLSKTGALGWGGTLSRLFGAAAVIGGEAITAMGEIVGTATVIFFTSGFLLAFFLPLLPFYRFFFGILSWFLGLFEAVIAVPLIALAHLTPEGEGFMGEKAKAAYYFVFNLFLKPILMIFGLIAGYIIFMLAVSAMNLLYQTAVVGTGGVSSGHFTLARIVYSVLYVIILYLVCNKCFQLIDWLPEHAIRWMGAQGLTHAPMGDPMELGGYMAVGANLMESKIVGSAGNLMKSRGGSAILGAAQSDPRLAAITRNSINSMGNTFGGSATEGGRAVTAALGKTVDVAAGATNAAMNVVRGGGSFADAIKERAKHIASHDGQKGGPMAPPPQTSE